MKPLFFLIPLSALILTACSNPNTPGEETPIPTTEGVIQSSPSAMSTPALPLATPIAINSNKTAAENIDALPELSIAASLIKAAGLDKTLSGNGPFTVFVPSNAAFNKLSPGTIDNWKQKNQKATLVKTLTFHAAPGKYKSTDFKDGQKVKTVEGEQLTITVASDGTLTVNGAGVQTMDLAVKNGVMYIIDTVLVPKK